MNFTTLCARVALFTLAVASPLWAQTPADERADDLVLRRKAAAYSPTKSEAVFLHNNILFEMSEAGWNGINLKGDGLLHSMSWWPRYLCEYAKRIGVGDIAAMDNSNNPDGAADTAQGLKGKVTIHLKDDPLKWNAQKAENYYRYCGKLVDFLQDYEGFTPKNGVVNWTFIMTPSVSDCVVTVNKSDGSAVIKMPSELEPSEWDTKMRRGLMKLGSFRI